jgi:hypothetical protein
MYPTRDRGCTYITLCDLVGEAHEESEHHQRVSVLGHHTPCARASPCADRQPFPPRHLPRVSFAQLVARAYREQVGKLVRGLQEGSCRVTNRRGLVKRVLTAWGLFGSCGQSRATA